MADKIGTKWDSSKEAREVYDSKKRETKLNKNGKKENKDEV